MGTTKIEWTATVNVDGSVTPGKTWNPTRGCSRVSQGCVHCYAERVAARFINVKNVTGTVIGPGIFRGYATHRGWTGKVELIESKLLEPLRWRKPAKVFVNSMSDLFHEALPDEAIDRVFAVMQLCPHLTFQVLTKRPDRMLKYLSQTEGRRVVITQSGIRSTGGVIWTHSATWPLPNVWLGVSVENQETADARIPLLLQTPAAVRFVSYEPALSGVDFAAYLPHNPVYEIQAERGVRISGDSERGPGDKTGRHDLETSETRVGPMETSGSQSPMQTSEGGARLRGVFPGAYYAGQSEDLRTSPQVGVSPLQGTDSAGSDNQPRGRQQETQPSRQLDVSNVFGAADPRDQRLKGGACVQPARDEKLDGQTNDRTSARDSAEAREGRAAFVDSQGLRSGISDRFQDSQRRPTLNLIIIGGESGPGARPFNITWARSVVEQCKAAGVACFVKQLGAQPLQTRPGDTPIHMMLRDRKGGDMAEWPLDLRVRQFPELLRK